MPERDSIMETKSMKAVLFLVEGDTDELALGGVIHQYLKPRCEYFQVIGTDITSAKDTKPSNILDKVNTEIKNKLDEIKLYETDLSAVVHLVDMDGAYVGEESIVEIYGLPRWVYTETAIQSSSSKDVLERNIRKSKNLDALQSISHVGKMSKNIPYTLLYMSCNLEHVLHHNANAPYESKRELADDFADRYYDHVDEFIRFISASDFSVGGTWKETWDFIKQGNHSLQRFTNFGLFFKEP